jgi:hypothetical protein
MNELMQQTHAGLAAHDRRLLREIRRLVDDVRRIGAEMDIASAARIDLRKCLISECSSLGRRCQAHRVSGADRGAVGRWIGERGITTAALQIVGGIGQVEALVGEQVTIPWEGGMTVA